MLTFTIAVVATDRLYPSSSFAATCPEGLSRIIVDTEAIIMRSIITITFASSFMDPFERR